MKVLFDTNVMVAAIIQSHAHHSFAPPWLERVKQGAIELLVSAHNLAELYVSLTRFALTPPVTPQEAWQLIRDDVLSVAAVVPVGPADYRQLIENASQQGLVGAILYDAVIAKAGEIAGVDYQLTLNIPHFLGVWSGNPAQVISPRTSSPP